MQLQLSHVGKVRAADIYIDGITVVAGSNDTGKSTIGKTLYCIFNSFFELQEKIRQTRFDMMNNAIRVELDSEKVFSIDVSGIADEFERLPELYLKKENWKKTSEMIEAHIDRFWELEEADVRNEQRNEVLAIIQRIESIKRISEVEIFEKILQQRVDWEFKKQITPLFNTNVSSKVKLFIKDKEIEIELRKSNVQLLTDAISLKTQAIYIDNPFVLDIIGDYTEKIIQRIRNGRQFMGHKNHLLKCLLDYAGQSDVEQAMEEIIVDNRLDEILKKINSVCPGDIRKNKFYHSFESNGTDLNIANISTGMKTFMILKKLLQNRYLTENGVIIFDEPEVHLHPEWQIIFAELIVLLKKDYGMHILLTTHSPYFLRAIEVYAAKYGIADSCHFYATENDGAESIVKDVTTSTDVVYKKLLQPFELLQEETYRGI